METGNGVEPKAKPSRFFGRRSGGYSKGVKKKKSRIPCFKEQVRKLLQPIGLMWREINTPEQWERRSLPMATFSSPKGRILLLSDDGPPPVYPPSISRKHGARPVKVVM